MAFYENILLKVNLNLIVRLFDHSTKSKFTLNGEKSVSSECEMRTHFANERREQLFFPK